MTCAVSVACGPIAEVSQQRLHDFLVTYTRTVTRATAWCRFHSYALHLSIGAEVVGGHEWTTTIWGQRPAGLRGCEKQYALVQRGELQTAA